MFTNTNNYNFDYDLQHAGYLYDLLKDTIIFQLSDTQSFISDKRSIDTKKLMIHRKGINGKPTKVVSKSELFYLLHYTIPDEIECSKKKILDKIKVEYYTRKGDQYKEELNKLNNMYTDGECCWNSITAKSLRLMEICFQFYGMAQQLLSGVYCMRVHHERSGNRIQ